MRLKCNSIQNLLSDYIDGILTENQTIAISRHLRHCSSCRYELETLETTNRLLKLYVEKIPPHGYLEELGVNLESKVKQRRPVWNFTPSASSNQFSLQKLITLLTLKYNGFKNGLLFKYEELKMSLNVREILIKSAVAVFLILMGIFIDKTYIRPSHKILSEFIRDSFYSASYYPSEFLNPPKVNSNRAPIGHQVKAARLIGKEGLENVSEILPVFHSKVGAIEMNFRAVSFKDGVLTFQAFMDISKLKDVDDNSSKQIPPIAQQSRLDSVGYSSEVGLLPRSLDLPEVPRMYNNKRPKFESWLSNLLTDVTLPTLSITDPVSKLE